MESSQELKFNHSKRNNLVVHTGNYVSYSTLLHWLEICTVHGFVGTVGADVQYDACTKEHVYIILHFLKEKWRK